MKIYVASKFEERQLVRRVQNALILMGHEITLDWTDHKYEDGGYPDEYSQDDVDGVKRADLYVGIFVNEHQYMGSLVEMGIALGCSIPVDIIGHEIDRCIFVHHPFVRTFDKVDDFVDYYSGKL